MNRKEWNKHAHTFEKNVCDITREETGDQLRGFVARARLPKKATLVDLGCGIGTFILRYGGRFDRIEGVEYASRTIARAKKRCAGIRGVTWRTMGIERASRLIGRRADLTVCMNVITSHSAARRAAQWRSIARVTRRGGYALIVVPSIESEEMVELEYQSRRKNKTPLEHDKGVVERDGAYQKHFARTELKRLMTDEGFSVERIGKIHYPWAKEGMRETPARKERRPWDWACLAKRL
ncbi:MAG TPA: class I SAM-dependent methyltransferase [Rhizomicrobium sp.]|nr:class I SAM-dependent methyltransferase [Rhizomicrobium sp.]